MRPYDRWDEGKADAKDFDLDLSAVIFNGKGNYVVRVPGSELYLSDPTPSHFQVMPNVTLPLTFSSLLKLSKFILSLAFLTSTASLQETVYFGQLESRNKGCVHIGDSNTYVTNGDKRGKLFLSVF